MKPTLAFLAVLPLVLSAGLCRAADATNNQRFDNLGGSHEPAAFGGGLERTLRGERERAVDSRLCLPRFGDAFQPGHGVYQSPQDLTYYVRSHLCPSFGFCIGVRKPGLDWELYLLSKERELFRVVGIFSCSE